MDATATAAVPKRRRIARKLAIAAGIVIALYFVAALGLIFWPGQSFKFPVPENHRISAASPETSVSRRAFSVRDGAKIAARIHGDDGLPVVLLIHGVAAQARDMDGAAALLAKTANVQVIAIDMRGHGQSSGRPWQLDHVGQFDEDVSDVVGQLRAANPGRPIILAGHSMGGGIATRYAIAKDASPVDGVLLLAPLLGEDSPSMKSGSAQARNETDDASVTESPVIFRAPRLIGVIMLHSVGITAFDQLPIMLFNHPDRPSYGFAALASMQPNAPSDYRVALQAVSKPLLLVAGTDDEYFEASAFPKIITENSKGQAALIDGANHESILVNSRAMDRISSWVSAIK